jgi:hypothetical protein
LTESESVSASALEKQERQIEGGQCASSGAGEERRERRRPLRVVVSASERVLIVERAAAACLSVSAYLRNLGVGWEPKSTLDHQAILALARINADQGRLGGLLKLWLSERPGQGASTVDARRLLGEIEAAQRELRKLLERL